MKRYNNMSLFGMMVVCSVATGLIGSEQQKPFFDQSTQDALKKPLKWYCGAYGVAWGLGSVASTAAVAVFSPFALVAGMVAKSDQLVRESLSPVSNIRDLNSMMTKKLLKTTPFTAVPVFGTALAWHKYKQNMIDKE